MKERFDVGGRACFVSFAIFRTKEFAHKAVSPRRPPIRGLDGGYIVLHEGYNGGGVVKG